MASLEFRGKGFVYSYHMTLPFMSLVPDSSRSVGAPEPDGNLIISGNGLLALKALLPRFAGRFNLLYAMPPYNNGVDGWRYDDDVPAPLTQEWVQAGPASRDDPDRHDKWLSWMLPRLRLMHELLAENGVLCVSIDDNEMHRLKSLLDEIFQEHNFLATLIWQKRYSPPPDVKDIGFVHECILVFRKTDRFRPRLLPLTPEQLARYTNMDNDPRGPWKPMDYTCRYTRKERPNLYYPITNPNTGEERYPEETRVWAFSQAEHKKNENDKTIWWGNKGKNPKPAFKNFAAKIQQGMVPTSFLSWKDVGHTDEAAKELRDLLPDVKHDTKPTRLIRHLLRMSTDHDGLVLFPFGGAGEGPHAVLELNEYEEVDGHKLNRRFVAINEVDADTIAAERLRRAIAEGLPGSFEYCSLGSPIDPESLLEGSALPSYEAVARYVFRTATGRPLDALQTDELTWRIGSTDTFDVHLIYRPDSDFLMSNEAMLGEKVARAIADLRERKKSSIVFASGKYLSQTTLSSLGIEFCPFPVAILQAILDLRWS